MDINRILQEERDLARNQFVDDLKYWLLDGNIEQCPVSFCTDLFKKIDQLNTPKTKA